MCVWMGELQICAISHCEWSSRLRKLFIKNIYNKDKASLSPGINMCLRWSDHKSVLIYMCERIHNSIEDSFGHILL